MSKTRFTESQIIRILKEQEAGKSVSDICWEHGLSQATFYQWKSTHTGMGVSQPKKMKELEAELPPNKKIDS